MLGVTVLILVIAVMTGFDRELRQKVIDFDAHILVTSEDVFRDWRALKAEIDKTPGVVATAPFVRGPVIVEYHSRRLAPLIRGIDPEQEGKSFHSRSSSNPASSIWKVNQRCLGLSWPETRSQHRRQGDNLFAG